MALRNANGPGRLSSPQPRFVKLDKKTQKYVAAIVDNLSTEQWATLTTGVDDVTKKDFTKICVGIVRDLTETTYKMCRPATTQKRMKETASSKSSPAPELESPKTSAFVAEIVKEVKQALSSVLSSSSPQTSSPSDGSSAWNTLFSRLEEQISTELMVRLEADDFFTRHRESSTSEEPDSQVDEVGEAGGDDKEADVELPEDAAEPEQEETTACTNDIICEMCDTYQMSQEEQEARLRAAATLDAEVSLATDHFVDSVMEDLRELASGGKVPAFRWVPKNLPLPPVMAAAAADPAIFTPQFRLAAQLKVSRILAQSESMPVEGPPSARAAASAQDIVGTLIKSLSKIRPDDDGPTTSRSAQQIYNKLESRVTVFLRGKPECDMDYSSSEKSADSDRDFDPSLKPQTSLQDRETPFQRAMGWFGRLFQETPEPSLEELTRTEDSGPCSTPDASGSETSAAQNDWPEVKQSNSQLAVEVQPQSPPPQLAPPQLVPSPLSPSVEAPSAPRAQSLAPRAQSPAPRAQPPTPQAQARPVNNILRMMCCINSPDTLERRRRGEGVAVAGRSPPTAQQRTMTNMLKVVCCINSPDIPAQRRRGESVPVAGRSQDHNQGHTSGRMSGSRDVADVKVIVDNEGSFSAY